MAIEGAAFIDRGWVDKVFRKAVEAEERVSLMQKLIKQKLGVAEVEEFFSDLAETHRNTNSIDVARDSNINGPRTSDPPLSWWIS